MIQYFCKIGKDSARMLLMINKNDKKRQYILEKCDNKKKTISLKICKKSLK